jgi:hypothetical protein
LATLSSPQLNLTRMKWALLWKWISSTKLWHQRWTTLVMQSHHSITKRNQLPPTLQTTNLVRSWEMAWDRAPATKELGLDNKRLIILKSCTKWTRSMIKIKKLRPECKAEINLTSCGNKTWWCHQTQSCSTNIRTFKWFMIRVQRLILHPWKECLM